MIAFRERELRPADDEHGPRRPMPRPTRSEVDRARRVVAEKCIGLTADGAPAAIVVGVIWRELAWLEAECERLSGGGR